MNEEQLLQEARIEAEKVYPILDVDSIPHNERFTHYSSDCFRSFLLMD